MSSMDGCVLGGCSGAVGVSRAHWARAAKVDGRWALAYAPPSEGEVPADLAAAIAADPAAQAMFDLLTKTNRFAVIHRVNSVKRAQTRER